MHYAPVKAKCVPKPFSGASPDADGRKRDKMSHLRVTPWHKRGAPAGDRVHVSGAAVFGANLDNIRSRFYIIAMQRSATNRGRPF